MNNFKKIGLSALAGSLAAMSVNAAELTATGGASISFAGQEAVSSGNGLSMNDSITFSGSTELDNGWTVSTSFLLDNSDGVEGSIFDARSITIDTGSAGIISFEGDDAAGAMGAVDDVMPTADGNETWDVLGASDASGATAELSALGSANSNNMLKYSSGSMIDGLTISASYTPSDGTTEVESSTDFAVAYTGYEGLTLGYAVGEDNAVAGTGSFDLSTMYVKYAYGPVTVGYQESEKEGNNATNTDEFEAFGITYAVTEDISVGFAESTIDLGSSVTDQVTQNVSFSYTMGGMSVTGSFIDQENSGGSTAAADDRKGYELGLAFAF
ncbi:porin [Candidatus Pelagibacter ubique]|nr:porin [Candidatus Pelagibacter ubique]